MNTTQASWFWRLALCCALSLPATAQSTATVRQIYPGCDALTGALTIQGRPVLGQSISMTTALPSLVGAQAALLISGTTPRFFFQRCEVHATPQVVIPLPANYANPVQLPVPQQASLVGLQLHGQAVLTAPAIPFAASNAFELTVGDR